MNTKGKKTLLFAVVSLVWITLVAIEVGATFDIGTTAFLGLFLIATIVGFFVATVYGLATKRWSSSLYLGIAFFVFYSALKAGKFISAHQRKASIAVAQSIISAAERFHSTTGTYPKSFDDLIPEYLPSEPRTKMGFRGTPFFYSSDSNRYSITFALPAWMLCSYDSGSKQWEVND